MRTAEPLYKKDKATGEYLLNADGTRKVVGYQLRVPRPTGGMTYVRFRTRREADAFAARTEAARSGGVTLHVGMRFEDAVKEFRAEHYIGLRPSAIDDYDRTLARAGRYFNGTKLRDLTPAKLSKFRDDELARIRAARHRTVEADMKRAAKHKDAARIAELEARSARIEGMGARTVNKVLVSLGAFLKFCMSRGYVATNAALLVKRLKLASATASNAPKQEAVFTVQEIAAAVDAAEPAWRAALQVLFFGGLRLGELLGLTWADIELKVDGKTLDTGNRILVRQQLCSTTGELRAPKTESGVRFVTLPPFVMSTLRAWKLACPPSKLDLAFPDSDGGPMDQHNFHNRVWRPALRRAGLRHIRVHDARHTAASLLISTGSDIASISRQLGHANVGITLQTYTHAFTRRAESDLGTKLAALVVEELGCEMVVPAVTTTRKSLAANKNFPKGQGIMSPLH